MSIRLGLLAWLLFLTATLDAASPDKETPDSDGFVSLFNGKDLDGWQLRRADRKGYVVEGGLLVCPEGHAGYLFTDEEYADFILRFDFRLSEGANSGIAIRTPLLDAKPAYQGTEIQLLDNPRTRGNCVPRNTTARFTTSFRRSREPCVPSASGTIRRSSVRDAKSRSPSTVPVSSTPTWTKSTMTNC